MNFAEIQKTWSSAGNRPSPTEVEKLKMNLITELKRRRRSSFMLLAITFVPLAFLTGKLVAHLVWPDPALDAVDLRREWGVLPFFALPWIGWAWMLRLHLGHRARHGAFDRSINASVRALLDENRTEMKRYKVVSALLAASVIVLPLIVFQLRAVGKAGDEILLPAFVLYPAYVLGVLIWFGVNYRRKLRPRGVELEKLLRSYDETMA